MSVGDMTPGEIHEYNGVMVRTAKNGAYMRVDNGQLVKGPDKPSFADPTVAQAASYTRWHGAAQDAYRRKVQDALRNRGDNTLIETIEQASGEALGVLAEEIVFNPDVPGRDRIRADQHIRQQAGIDGREPAQVSDNAPGLALSNEIAHRLLDVIEQAQQTRQNVIDTRSPNE